MSKVVSKYVSFGIPGLAGCKVKADEPCSNLIIWYGILVGLLAFDVCAFALRHTIVVFYVSLI